MAKNWKIGGDTARAKQKAATHKRILTAAFELFEANGFYETTTSQIAKRAGVSAGSIYAHFGSPGKILSELHVQVLKDRARRLRETRESWSQDHSAWDLLMAMLDEVWGVNREIRVENVTAYQSWSWVCSADDYVPMREMYRGIIDELEIVVDMAKAEGVIPDEVDTRTTIEVLTAAFFQGLQEARHGSDVNVEQNALFKERVAMLFRVNRQIAAE